MENQQSVYEWTRDTFPEYQGKTKRAMAVLEEAVELAIAAGVAIDDIRKIVEIPIIKQAGRTDLGDDHEEAADVLLNIYSYAGTQDFDVHQELDQKMALNRSRSNEYYRGKIRQKIELGMPGLVDNGTASLNP